MGVERKVRQVDRVKGLREVSDGFAGRMILSAWECAVSRVSALPEGHSIYRRLVERWLVGNAKTKAWRFRKLVHPTMATYISERSSPLVCTFKSTYVW